MNDYCLALLEQYDIEVLRIRKGRGAYIIETPGEQLIFKEYVGTEERARLQSRVLSQIEEAGEVPVEKLFFSKEENAVVRDTDGSGYILKTCPEGRELNIADREECIKAVRTLARMHKSMILEEEASGQAPGTTASRYEKGRKELRRVHKYLLQRSQKTDFEISLMKHYGYFQEQADCIHEQWQEYSKFVQTDPYVYCHGEYQYHNILFAGSRVAVVNFEKMTADNQIRDLYLLMRKLLEKCGWSVELGSKLLEQYERERPLSAIDRIDLYYRLAYPEKFRKVVNFYYNSGKAWIPGRNQEKLDKIIEQEKEKQYFLDKVFREPGNGI